MRFMAVDLRFLKLKLAFRDQNLEAKLYLKY